MTKYIKTFNLGESPYDSLEKLFLIDEQILQKEKLEGCGRRKRKRKDVTQKALSIQPAPKPKKKEKPKKAPFPTGNFLW